METYMGEIVFFGGNFAPQGWMACDGKELPISGNEALFSLIGVMYGGDGRSTFALPKIAPPPGVPDNTGKYIINVGGAYPSRH